tara:strand:+ start:808 stop:11907 length:11100 start_codon:yes stop_codon:yes gene_type:complete
MSTEDSSKQAAISSDSGVVQDATDENLDELVPSTKVAFGADANEGASSRFSEPTSPSFAINKPYDETRIGPITGARSPHPSFYRNRDGSVQSTPTARQQAQEAYNLSQQMPTLEDELMTNASVYATGDRNILSMEELQEADDGGWLEYIGTAFEGFDAPRRLAWAGVAWAGEALPDPGTMLGDAVQSFVGTVGGYSLGATIGAVETTYMPIGGLGSLFADEEVEENPIYPIVPGQEMIDSFGQMAENLYGSIATGEISDTALNNLRPWLWGDWSEGRVVSGDSLIDAMLTREQAYELSLNEDAAPHMRSFARHVSTDTGRLAYGILAEFILDPLWFSGPGKGIVGWQRPLVKMINGVETAVNLRPVISKAAGSMQMVSMSHSKNMTLRNYQDVLATIVVGNADESANAASLVTKYAETAEASVLSSRALIEKIALSLSDGTALKPLVLSVAESKYTEATLRAADFTALDRVDTATKILKKASDQKASIIRLADNQVEAAKFLTLEVKRLAAHAKTFSTHEETISMGLRLATSSRSSGGISDALKTKGFLSFHIPFTEKYGYAFSKGPIKQASEVLNSVPFVAKIVDDFSLAALQGKIDEAALGVKTGERLPDASMVFADNKAAELAYTMQMAAGKSMLIPMAAWGLIAKAFGTRHIQPMVQMMSEDAYNKAGHLLGTTFGSKFIAKMRRAQPEVWGNYQDAITDMSMAFNGMEMQLRSGHARLVSAGNKALKERKKQKGKKLVELRRKLDAASSIADKTEIRFEIAEVSRWGTKNYTLDDLLLDTMDADERALGEFGFLSDEMKAVAAEARALVDSVVNNPKVAAGKMRVEQALVAIIRDARGDREHQIKLMSQLEMINISLEKVSNFKAIQKIKAQKALLTRVTQLRSLKEGIENIDSDVLVKTLEELRSIRETGVYDEAVHAEHIFNFIKKLTKSDIAARQILRRFALGMGEADGGTALAKLVVRLTGSFDYASDAKKLGFSSAMQRAVNGYLSDLKKEYKILSKAYRDGHIVHDGSQLSVGGSDLSLTIGGEGIPGMTRKDFRILVKTMIDENDSTWKLMIPETEHQAFKAWIDGPSSLELPLKPRKTERKSRSKVVKAKTKAKEERVAKSKSEPSRLVVMDSIKTFILGNTVRPETRLHGTNVAPLKGLISHLSADPNIESKYLELLVYLNKHLGDDVLVATIKPGDHWGGAVLDGNIGLSTAPDKAAGAHPRTVWIGDFGESTGIHVMEVLAHETVHAATVIRYAAASKDFADGVVSASSKASDDIRKLFNFVVEHSNKKKGLPDGVDPQVFRNALSSPQEMMAYGMSNEGFYRWLDGIAYKPKAQLSVLHVLIEKVKRLFGMANEDGLAAELSRHIDDLFRGADPPYFPGINNMHMSGKNQIELFPDVKGLPGTKEHAQTSAARTQAINRSDRLNKVRLTGKKEKVFNFEPSENVTWNQARTYYERIAHLRTVSQRTKKFTTKQTIDLAQARLGILKPLKEWTKHERFRLQDELKGTGVRIWSRLLLNEDHAWYFAKPRPALARPPVEVKSVAAVVKATEEPVVAPEPVVAKPKAVPTTEPAQVSHEAKVGGGLTLKPSAIKDVPAPKREYTPSKLGGKHARGVLARSGTYRNVSDDKVFMVRKVQTVSGTHYSIFEQVKGSDEIRSFPGRKFSSRESGQTFLKKLDDEAMPVGRLTVKVKAKTKTMLVEALADKPKSFNVWTDPNSAQDYFFVSAGGGARRSWSVTDAQGNIILTVEPVVEGGSVVKRASKANAEKALEERLNVLDGDLVDTVGASKVATKISKAAAKEGDLNVKPVVVERLSESTSSSLTLGQMKAAGYVKHTPGYKPQKDDVIAMFTSDGTVDEEHFRIVQSIQTADGYEITLVNHLGELDDSGYIEDIFESLDEIMILRKGAAKKPAPKKGGLTLKSKAGPAKTNTPLVLDKAPTTKPAGLTLKGSSPTVPLTLKRGAEKYIQKPKPKPKVDMFPEESGAKALKNLGWERYNTMNIFTGTRIAIYQSRDVGRKLDLFQGGTVVGTRSLEKGKESDLLFVLEAKDGTRTEISQSMLNNNYYTEEAGDDTIFSIFKARAPTTKYEGTPLVLKSLKEAEKRGFVSPESESGAFRRLRPDTKVAIFDGGEFKGGGTIVMSDNKVYTLREPSGKIAISELTRLSKGGPKGDDGVTILVKRPVVSKTVEAKSIPAEELGKRYSASSVDPNPLNIDAGDAPPSGVGRDIDPTVAPPKMGGTKAMEAYRTQKNKFDKEVLGGTKVLLVERFESQYNLKLTEELNIPAGSGGIAPPSVIDDLWETLIRVHDSILEARPLTADDLMLLDDVVLDLGGMMGTHTLRGVSENVDTYYRYFLTPKSQKYWKKSQLHNQLTHHAQSLKVLEDAVKQNSGSMLKPYHDALLKTLRGLLTSDFEDISLGLSVLQMGNLNKVSTMFPQSGTFAMAKSKPFFHPNMMREQRIKDALKGATPDETAEAILHVINRGDAIDPMVTAILKKALKKHSVPLKSIFNAPDAFLSRNLEKELITLKEGITSFLKTPDGPLPKPRDITRFINPTSRTGMTLKGGKDTRGFADNALGQVQKGTINEKGPLIKRTSALIERYKNRRKALDEHMGETRPHFGRRPDEMPGDEVDPAYRPLENWEMRLWDDYEKIAKSHGLNDLDKIQAVFTVLRETPKLVNKDMYPELAKMYPSLLGNRYGDDLDPTLIPAMREFRKIINTYQDHYEQRSYDWIASPERIMREWGVLNFVPHIFKELDVNKVREITLGKVFSGGGNGIDQVLWTGKDVNRSRELVGSIQEIKAMLSPNHDKVITLDPVEIWGRFTQVNRAMTNEDFMLVMLNTGVARFLTPIKERDALGNVTRLVTVEDQAKNLDLVPWFSRTNKARSTDLVNRGSLRDWLENGIDKNEVSAVLRDMDPDTTDIFSTWLHTSPKIQDMHKTQQAVIRIRGAQFHEGKEMLNPTKIYQERMKPIRNSANDAWERTRGAELRTEGASLSADDIIMVKNHEVDALIATESEKVWSGIAKEINKHINEYGITAPKLDAGHLARYYSGEGQLTQAWIPRVIAQSMRDTLEMGQDAASGPLGLIKKPLDLANAWWKTRVTVTSVAFSTRNAISNSVSNILDIGVFGVTNPKTLLLSTQISAALLIKEEYGTIAKFLEEASKKGVVSRFLKGDVNHKFSLRRLHEDGVDFGNGIVMDLDDVLDDMVGSGVLSPAFTQFTDINRAEMSALEAFAEGGAIRRGLSRKYLSETTGLAGGVDIEDAVVVMISMGITGGIPVALPKNFGGKHLARVVENQARAHNFIANFRKSNSWSDAAAHSNKFLFDYGDLTQFQRQVMRTIFPFFTWSIKNAHLQMDMMQKSPRFFAQFHRIMTDGVPQVFESSQTEGGYLKSDPLDLDVLRLRESHYRHTIGMPLPSLQGTGIGNIPVPVARRTDSGNPLKRYELGMGTIGKDYFPTLKGAKLQGLGLPQEALLSNIASVSAWLDPRNTVGSLLPDALGGKTARARSYSDRNRLAKIMGELHFLLRFASESMSGRHAFYDKDIEDLTDGRLINEITRRLDAIPGVGGAMKSYMHHVTGLKTYTYYDKFNQKWRTKVNVHGKANYTLSQLPWMRNFRDAAAATEMFFAQDMLPREELLEGGSKLADMYRVPFSWTISDSMSGVNIRQVDLQLQKDFAKYKLRQMRLKQLHSLGILKTYKQEYVPYK